MSSKSSTPKPTVLTLTLPEADSESKSGTLLVQRGDLARVHQFTYERIADLTEVIADALIAFAAVEADPPIIPDQTPPKPQSRKQAEQPAPPSEPTVDIPLKKGNKAVKISHLKITGGETDAAAYRQAVMIAGKLIDGKLWDGDSPIRIDDVYALAKKMKHLTERDLSLFALTDFVRVGDASASDAEALPDVMEVLD
ncbi:MAG: hypothetical protein HUU31_14550 [Anaerolineae bacterium]|nr:hypothetical protein [Anaerolineae bacterium]